MGATSPISLTVETVASGATVDISIGMTAPETNGQYTSYWQMQNASGAGFGVTFYVEIIVGDATVDPEATLDATLTATETVITPTPTRTKQFGPRATPTP